MELKTDKIHRILNTPYDELRSDDFVFAQEQLDVLVVGARDKQIDAFQFIENKLVCERDAARAERDQFKGICERLKRELEEAKSDILGAQMATQREYGEVRDDLYKARVRITELETQLREVIASRDLDEAGMKEWAKERATHAEVVAGLEDRIRVQYDLLQVCSRVNPKDHAELATELEQAKVQAANAAAMVVSITAERDAVQARETKLLWLIAGATERAERAEQQAKDERERRERYREIDDRAVAILREQHAKDLAAARGARVVKSTDDLWPASMAAEFAAAEEAQNKREAELDAYGYGRAPGTPPAEVVGLDGFIKEIIKDKMTENPHPLSHRELLKPPADFVPDRDAVKVNYDADTKGVRDQLASLALGPAGRPDQLQAIRDLPLNERGGPMATSADGKTWWCPDCQASLVPGKLHQCPANPSPIICDMPTPNGRCMEQAYDMHGNYRYCKRHLDAVSAGAREYEVQQAEASDKLPG